MPVAVACSCGAKLRVPDTAAGKRVKCPKCGDVLAVPAAEAEFEVVDDEPPPVKRKPRVLDEDDAPRPAKRTAVKSKPVEVNEAVDDDEDEEEDERPRKKAGKGKGKSNKVKGKNREQEKKKRMWTLILGICGATFVLGAVGVVVAIVMNSQDPAKAGMSTTPSAPPKPALPSGWKTFKGDGFSVGVPADVPFAPQQTPPRQAGAVVTAETKMYGGNAPPQAGSGPLIYVATKTPVPAEEMAKFNQNREAMWEELRAKAKATPNTKLRDEKPIQVGGVEGRQFFVEQGFGSGVVRVVVKDGHVFQWGVVRVDQAPEEDDPVVKPFLDSFAFE